MRRFLFLLAFTIITPIYPEDWKDLDEGEKKDVYGSEKSKKYTVSNIFGEVEKWDKHYGVRILYLYDYTDYPKYSSTQLFPFYYRINSKIDNREKFRFLNYTSKKERDETDKSLLPLIYWGGNTKTNHDYHSALPFYSYSNTRNESVEKNNLILYPATFYYSYESKKSENYFKENHFSILHGRVLERYKSTNQNKETSFWFPVVPLLRYTQLEDSYYHYIIPIYGYYRKESPSEEQMKFGFSIFPFSYSRTSYPIADKNRHYDITHWTLFHYRSLEEDTGGFKEYTHKSKWGFPVLPLLFYSSFEQGEGNYKRILTLFHWENSEKGDLNAFSFLPFVFYKKKDYFRIPLLLVDKDLSAPTASYGRTFVPPLLYYNKWDPSNQTFVLGPWVSLSSDVKKETTQTLFPIYFRNKSEKRDITLILPVYVNYNDKENDYHFNLLWFSRSSSGVVNPSLSLGKKESKWYFDTDLTVLYYMASISFRKTIEQPKFLRNVLDRNKSYEELEEEKKKELALAKPSVKQADTTPKLTRKKSVSREDSLNFSGYSLLFGLLSYEAADSRRHFRLLPLSWFSWDKESSDKVYVAPLFLWYQSDLLEYFVFFPFYGKQKDETSEKKAILLNGYISETYKEENWKETSVVWPFVNWYSSDKKSGHRVLPLYIQKNFKSKDSETNQNYTLFSYYNKTEADSTSMTSFLLWPTLTYYESYKRKEQDADGKQNEYKSSTLWVTPFFYRDKNADATHTNLFWIFDIKYFGEKLDRFIAFPFYYFNDGNFGIFPLTLNKKSGSNFWTFTLFNYLKISEKNFYYNFLFLAEAEKTPNLFELNLLMKGFQLRNVDSDFSFHGLWEYGWNFTKSKGKWEEASILWYLGGGYRGNETKSIYNISLLFYHESGIDYYQNWTLGNYRRNSKEGLRNNFLYLVDYEYFASDKSFTWDFLFTGIRYHSLKQENYFQGGYGYAWNFRKENDIWSDASVLWLGYSSKREETIYNFLPIIRTYDFKDEHSRIYGPMLLYTSEEAGKNFHLGLFGLGYWYKKDERTREEDTYILLGTIYREYTEKERGFRARGSLWGWLWDYQKEEETSFEKYSVLKLFSYTKEADGTKKILGISF